MSITITTESGWAIVFHVRHMNVAYTDEMIRVIDRLLDDIDDDAIYDSFFETSSITDLQEWFAKVKQEYIQAEIDAAECAAEESGFVHMCDEAAEYVVHQTESSATQ